MRITFVLPHIRIGGGVCSTLELANRLQDKGNEVVVVYPWTELSSGSRLYNVRTLAGKALELARSSVSAPRLAGAEGKKTRCALGKLAGDVSKAFRCLANPRAIAWFDLRAGLLRVPTLAEKYIPEGDIIVATWWANAHEVNGYGPEKGEKFHFIRAYETWGGPEELVNRAYTLPLHKLVTSRRLKDLIEDRFGVSTIGPLPNGVNFDIFYREADGFALHSPKRVGILYRRQRGKGVRDGLEAFARARKYFPDTRLVLFGVKPMPGDMKIIKTIDGVEYHHLPSGAALRGIYNSLDIFLFPSHSEGFGNPPMEAMACGVACAATDVGAVRDYAVPGETALVSPPGDVESLARNLIRLLEDEEMRRRIAGNGHKHIQQFTWERTADRLEEIFERIVKRDA